MVEQIIGFLNQPVSIPLVGVLSFLVTIIIIMAITSNRK